MLDLEEYFKICPLPLGKLSEILNHLFENYSINLYWVERKVLDHWCLKYVFTCTSLDLEYLAREISDELRNLHLKVWVKAPHPKLTFLYASNNTQLNLLILWEKYGKIGILGLTRVESIFMKHFLSFTFYGLVAIFSTLFLIIIFELGDLLPHVFHDLLMFFLRIIIVIFFIAILVGSLLRIVIDAPMNYYRCVKHGEMVMLVIKDVIEKMCSTKFKFVGKFPFKFPKITDIDVAILKKQLEIKG